MWLRRPTASKFATHISGDVEYVGLGEAATDPATFVVPQIGDLSAMFGPACVSLACALVLRARVRSAARGYRDGEARAAAGVEIPPLLDLGALSTFQESLCEARLFARNVVVYRSSIKPPARAARGAVWERRVIDVRQRRTQDAPCFPQPSVLPKRSSGLQDFVWAGCSCRAPQWKRIA